MGFVRAGKVADVPTGTICEVQVEGKTIAMANVAGAIHAIHNACLHRGGPLGQGVMDGKLVTCPWHGWSYDVTNGKVGHNQAVGVACYPVEVRGDEIYVDIDLGH
jgi:nitrite reductase (NADH) small subunit